jgi:hypothetical protein
MLAIKVASAGSSMINLDGRLANPSGALFAGGKQPFEPAASLAKADAGEEVLLASAVRC